MIGAAVQSCPSVRHWPTELSLARLTRVCSSLHLKSREYPLTRLLELIIGNVGSVPVEKSISTVPAMLASSAENTSWHFDNWPLGRGLHSSRTNDAILSGMGVDNFQLTAVSYDFPCDFSDAPRAMISNQGWFSSNWMNLFLQISATIFEIVHDVNNP